MYMVCVYISEMRLLFFIIFIWVKSGTYEGGNVVLNEIQRKAQSRLRRGEWKVYEKYNSECSREFSWKQKRKIL